MEHPEKKKKQSDEFRWIPEELRGEDPESEPELDSDVDHVDFITSDGPLRLVTIIDEYGDMVSTFYEIPPSEASIWMEWHNRQLARRAFALTE